MGLKDRTYRSDCMMWEIAHEPSRKILNITIKSRRMFRKGFLSRIPGIQLLGSNFGYNILFANSYQGLFLYCYDTYRIATSRDPRWHHLTIGCKAIKTDDRGKISWKFAEEYKQVTEVQAGDGI